MVNATRMGQRRVSGGGNDDSVCGRAGRWTESSGFLQDLDLVDRLRMRVPHIFVVCSAALAVLSLAAIAAHLSLGHFSSAYRSAHTVSLLGGPLLRGSLVPGHSGQRLQDLQEEEATSEQGGAGEDTEEAIRFENDNRVGGGDLMVPVSMVDYENLGEGSIVDQRYPRKLPGADELEAEWNALWDWDWDDDADESAAAADSGDNAAAQQAVVQPPVSRGGTGRATRGRVGRGNSKLEDMGVNVNGYRKHGHK